MDSQSNSTLEQINDLLEHGTVNQVSALLNEYNPADIASLLESLPQNERKAIWELVSLEKTGEVLAHVNDTVRAALIKVMDADELIQAIEVMDIDDLADILPDIPDHNLKIILRSLDKQRRSRLERVLPYAEDTAGGLMNTDTITIRAHITLDVVLRYLRVLGSLPELTDNLIVVDRTDKYLGMLSLTDLVTQEGGLNVAKVMKTDLEGIPANMPANDVATLFQRRDLVSAPVIDDDGTLLGRITIDDVVDVIRDSADHSLMSMAGLNEEEDMFAPVVASSRRRAIWLGLNLLTALFASWVIGLFDATIEKLVALAVLMPIVASMGGIAGNQTLTLVIRGLAVGQIGQSNAQRLLMKELAVGLLNGLLWSVVVAVVTATWFDDVQLGVIIAAAMLINLIAAALAGATIPLILRRYGIDPALAGGVILTTVTDVVGFISFLGLATLLLL